MTIVGSELDAKKHNTIRHFDILLGLEMARGLGCCFQPNKSQPTNNRVFLLACKEKVIPNVGANKEFIFSVIVVEFSGKIIEIELPAL